MIDDFAAEELELLADEAVAMDDNELTADELALDELSAAELAIDELSFELAIDEASFAEFVGSTAPSTTNSLMRP